MKVNIIIRIGWGFGDKEMIGWIEINEMKVDEKRKEI